MDISVWYCCLNPAEQGCMLLCSDAFVASLGIGFPKAVYDVYWLTVLDSRIPRSDAFAFIYHLRFGEFAPNPETPPVEWVFFDDPVSWLAWSLYVLSPFGLCGEGCSLVSYLSPVT